MEVKKIEIEEIEKVMEIINDAIAFLRPQSKQWQQGYPNVESMTKDILNHNLWVFRNYIFSKVIVRKNSSNNI